MAKGLYAGLDLEGSVVKVRDSLNTAYCDKDLRPADIIVKKDCSNAKNGPAFFFAFSSSDPAADYSFFLMTVTAVALKKAFTSFPSVNDNSSKE